MDVQIKENFPSSYFLILNQIEPDSRQYTTFVSPLGNFQFIWLPFGLCNAPSRYSRIVQMALDKIGSEFCPGFVDDVIVHSSTFEEHLQHLERVWKLMCKLEWNWTWENVPVFKTLLITTQGEQRRNCYDTFLCWPSITMATSGNRKRSFLFLDFPATTVVL